MGSGAPTRPAGRRESLIEGAVGAAREVEVAFLMADLSGFTALTETHGDMHAATVAMRYVEIAQSALDPRARLVERVGDQVLIVAPDGDGAVRTAMRVFAAIEREPLFPRLRAGIHGGRVVEQDGRYFGTALNLTARLTAHARAGQILCTELIAAAAHDLGGSEIQDIGLVRFKNIADPVRVFEVLRRQQRAVLTDPVCRMQVREQDAPARLPFGGMTYYFCSFACAETFAERPEHYASG